MITTRKFQNEKPVDTDLFGGQGHKQVADAIASVLLFDANQHIIGIEGNLGSGKSSVINILQKNIEDNGFHVVTFDADQYHTTLKSALIKTIEVELEKLLVKKDKYKRAKLESAVETALGKRLEYTKNTTSHVSFSAIIFAFSLGVSALQVKPSLKFLYELTTSAPKLDKLSGWLSIALFTSPVLVYLVMRVLRIKTSLGDLVKRNSKDTISETIDINREVGAVELKNAFETFSSLIPKDKTLLLVIDNIDRVSPDKARELWSDIETLTSLGSERFRILLPYSEEHLAKALEKSAVDESQSGKEFISKRIPVPFSAPPIVTMGWRNQFEEYWNETLPDITGQEGVKDLIEIWERKITPRYLKSIVNRIGAKIDSCPESNDLLSGVSCAAYLLAVRDCKLTINQLLSDPKSINSTDETPSDIERKLNATHKVLLKYGGEKECWSKQVAALHYQTSFSVAQSELIADPIRTALNTYDAKMLLELSPLLGFDVLFKHQLTATDADDLVKIAGALIHEENGGELVDKYLNDINHEIRYSTISEYNFDEDLIESYTNLRDAGIDIDLKIAKNRQNQVTKTINEIWEVMQVLEASSDLFNAKYSWNDLEGAVKECYSHYCVTGLSPNFVKKPNSYFVVNALFPIKAYLKQWNVPQLIESLKTSDLVIAAAKRQNILDSDDTIFPVLLEKMHIGELDALSNKYHLIDENISSVDVNMLLDVLPFTNKWRNRENKNYYQQLVSGLESHKESGSLDDATLDEYTALCAASLVNELTPEGNVIVKQPNNQNRAQQAAVWLASKLKEQTDYSYYLTDYLSFCPLSKILSWCKSTQVGSYLLPHLEKLIDTNRIDSLDIEDLLTDDYVFLKQNAKSLTPKVILEWMEGWHKFAKNPLSWNTEVIEDIIHYESKGFVAVLTEYFDNQNNTQEEWLERIKVNDPRFGQIANYLANLGNILTYQKPLQQALKTIPEDSHSYDVELVETLTSLLDEGQRNGIRISLQSAFFKTDTTLERRYRTIRYFGSLINMPTINDSSLEIEAIALLDDSMSNGKNEEKEWLLSQPVDNSGWNITEWSIDNLKSLYSLLNDDPDAKQKSFAKAVADRLDLLVENDNAASVA